MASFDKIALVNRLANSRGRGSGANTGLGTADVLIPQLPSFPDDITPQSLQQFRDDMDRWRISLQAQFPVPQSTAQPATTATPQVTLVSTSDPTIQLLTDRLNAFIEQTNRRLRQLEDGTGGSDIDNYTTVQDVKDIIKNARYTHSQGVSAAVWTIRHGLNWKPSVTIVDSSQNVVCGDIEYVSMDELTVTFAAEFSGYAYLN